MTWMRHCAMAAIFMAGVATAAPDPRVILNGDGLTAGDKKLTFDKTSSAAAIAAVATVLGKPTAVGNHGDCGQGSTIRYAKFRGHFELSFVKGHLSGWTEDSAALATDRGIRLGATLAALRKAYPDVSTDNGNEAEGGIGPSFQREGGPNGWLDGVKPSSRIAGLFAGVTCLPGI